MVVAMSLKLKPKCGHFNAYYTFIHSLTFQYLATGLSISVIKYTLILLYDDDDISACIISTKNDDRTCTTCTLYIHNTFTSFIHSFIHLLINVKKVFSIRLQTNDRRSNKCGIYIIWMYYCMFEVTFLEGCATLLPTISHLLYKRRPARKRQTNAYLFHASILCICMLYTYTLLSMN